VATVGLGALDALMRGCDAAGDETTNSNWKDNALNNKNKEEKDK
jgi:hypothetical protein